MDRKSLDGDVYDGNDVDGVDDWGGAEGSGSPLGVDVYGDEHEDGNEGVPLQLQSPCVRVGVQNRAESGEVVLDPFPNSLKAVH